MVLTLLGDMLLVQGCSLNQPRRGNGLRTLPVQPLLPAQRKLCTRRKGATVQGLSTDPDLGQANRARRRSKTSPPSLMRLSGRAFLRNLASNISAAKCIDIDIAVWRLF